MRIRAASIVGSGASLIASVAVPIAFPHIDPWVGRWLLVAAFALAALAVGLYWPHSKGDGEGGPTVTTHGPHSPGIGSVGRDVHFHNHPAPAATQERKQAVSPGPQPARLQAGKPERREPLRTTNEGASLTPSPDLPLNGVLALVYKHLGGAPDDPARRSAFYRKVDLEIQDKIVEKGLHVWGRFGRRARELLRERSLKRGWLNHREQTFYAPTLDSSPMEFTDLYFNKAEVFRVWPPPRRTNDEG